MLPGNRDLPNVVPLLSNMVKEINVKGPIRQGSGLQDRQEHRPSHELCTALRVPNWEKQEPPHKDVPKPTGDSVEHRLVTDDASTSDPSRGDDNVCLPERFSEARNLLWGDRSVCVKVSHPLVAGFTESRKNRSTFSELVGELEKTDSAVSEPACNICSTIAHSVHHDENLEGDAPGFEGG